MSNESLKTHHVLKKELTTLQSYDGNNNCILHLDDLHVEFTVCGILPGMGAWLSLIGQHSVLLDDIALR